MGVYEGRGQISNAYKLLERRWRETKESWNDEASRHFEKKYLEPLEIDLKSAVTSMDHIAAVLSRVRRDCQ